MEEFDKKLRSTGYEYLYEPYYTEEAGSMIVFAKTTDGNNVVTVSFNNAY